MAVEQGSWFLRAALGHEAVDISFTDCKFPEYTGQATVLSDKTFWLLANLF